MDDSASLLNHPAIGRRVFYPRSTRTPPTLWVEANGYRLGCHVRRPHPDAGWVVYFHGNGELAAGVDHFCAALFDGAGVNSCFVEYRGYGASNGEPTLAGMLGDGEQVVAALGVLPRRVAAFGRSLGSLYAIELAHRLPGLAGLVVESGIAAVAEVWPLDEEEAGVAERPGAVAAALATHFDQRSKLEGYTGPLLVLHAAGDYLVNRSHAERLHAWGAGDDKRLVVFPRGDHNTILPANEAAYAAALRAFFQEIGLSAGTGEVAEPGTADPRR